MRMRYVSVTLQECPLACVRAYIARARMDNPWFALCDRNVADTDAIIGVEEGGVGVGECAVPGPSESRDESESYVYCYVAT